MTDLDAFIAGLPKAELHVHHFGSASPEVVAGLAARHEGSTSVPADPAAADVTRDVALQQRPDGLVGFGLGGPEIGVPRTPFAPHFAAARAAGLHRVPHAGESSGPDTVWDAVRLLGAERIGHGIIAAQDPALLDHLAEHGIPPEISLTSNVCTRSVAGLAVHPLPQIAAAGVPSTINTDDPPMFATDLGREYAVAASLLGLDHHGVADLSRAAVRQSFLDEAGKSRLLAEIDAYVATA